MNLLANAVRESANCLPYRDALSCALPSDIPHSISAESARTVNTIQLSRRECFSALLWLAALVISCIRNLPERSEHKPHIVISDSDFIERLRSLSFQSVTLSEETDGSAFVCCQNNGMEVARVSIDTNGFSVLCGKEQHLFPGANAVEQFLRQRFGMHGQQKEQE